MTYEKLQHEYPSINILETDLSAVKDLKGLCIDDNIAIEQTMTSIEKSCVLAEELGHYHTSFGNILNMDDVRNRKQERLARLWGYNKLIGLTGIIKAYRAGCQNRHEIAELLGVTEDFLQDCIDCYKEKYGAYTTIDNYTIFFIPTLAVLEKYDFTD